MELRNIHVFLENTEVGESEIFKGWIASRQLIVHKSFEALVTAVNCCDNPNKILIITDICSSEVLATQIGANGKYLVAVLTDTFSKQVKKLFSVPKLNYLIGKDVLKDEKLLASVLHLLNGTKIGLTVQEMISSDILATRSFVLRSTKEKENIITTVENLINNTYKKDLGGFSNQYAISVATIIDELLLNAIFDANPRLADQLRHVDYALNEHEWVNVEVVLGKTAIGVSVKDKFGSLKKEDISTHFNQEDVFRKIATKQSAGIGIRLALNASSQIVFNVVQGRFSEVIAVVCMHKSLLKFKRAPKSVVFSTDGRG